MLKLRKLFNAKIISLIVSSSFLFTNTLYAYPDSKDTLRPPVGQIEKDRITAVKFEVFLSLTERKLDDDKAAQYVSERRRRGRDVLILNPETMQFEIKPADEIPGYVVYRLKDGERIDGYLRFRYVLVPSPLGMRAMISKEKAKDILQDALNKPELAGRTFTQENIDAVQRLISAGADFNVISDSNGNGIQISQVGSTSIPTTLLDFLRSSAYFNSKVFPKIKAVAVDMDGTLIGGTPDSEGEAIDALIRLLDVVERVYIVSSNEFKNVENKIIHRVPVGKRHKISVFSARGTILTEFDEYGNALPKTTTLGEKHIQNSFLTETHLQEIRSAVNSVASEFNQDVRDGGPETDRTWKERYPGFYNGFYINSTGKHDEHRARINKTDRNGKIVSIRRVIQVEEHRYADMVITQFPSKKYALNRTDDERPEFIRRVKEKLSADILSLIDIVPESSVGIGIKRKGVGKSIAMQEILKSFKSDEVIYFGDEFWEGGMDREIAEEFPITAVAVDEDQSRIHSKAWGSIAGATNLDATAQWFTALLENKVKMNIQGLKEENYFLSVFIDPDLMSAATKIIPMIKKHAYEFEKERGRPLNRKELSDFVQWDEEILARASNRKIQQIPDLLIISGINIDTSSKNGISAAKEIFNQMMTVPFEEVGDVIRELRDPKKRREAIIALKWMANVAELSEDGYLSERNRAREVLEKFLEIFFSDFNGKKILDAFAQMAEEKISEKIDQGVNPEEILVVPVLTSGEQIGQYVASRVKRTKNVVSQPLLFTTAMTYAFGRMENEEIPRQGKVFTEVGKRNALRYLEQEGILKKNLKHIIFIDTGMTGSFGKLFDSVFEGTGISTELLLIDHADYEKAKVEKIWAHGLNDEEAWSDREKELRWMTIIFDQFIEHSEESPSHLMEGVSDGGFIRVARRPTNHPWFAGFVKQEFDRMAKQDAGVYISTRGGGDNALLTEERLEQAKEILRLFGIDKIESARDLEGNVVNENNPVLVRLDTEKVVLRKFQYTKSQIRFIVSVMNKLKAEGIPVPRLYRRAETKSSGADSYIAEYRGEYYILEEFIDAGEHVPLKDVTNDHFRAIARLAAKINNVLAGFQPEGAKQYTSRRAIAKNIRTSFIEFKEYVEAMSVTNRQEAHSLFLEHFDLLIEQLDVFDAGYNPRAQKTSVVHGDMHPVNTKFDKNGRIVGLVDFDFTITDHRVVEFNNLVMGKNVTDRPYSRTKLLAIVSAYNSAVNEKLDDEEIRAVIQIIRLRFLEGMKNRYVKENGFVDPERFKASIEALNQFNNDFATDDQINAFIQEVERATTKMSTERGRLKNLQAVDWLINRVENIQGILISARVRKKFEVLLYDHYVNEITPHVDAYGDGLYEQEKRQLYLLAREAGIFHNGTFDEAGFSLDVQINGELEQQMFRARTEFYERMEELKQLSRHYWEAELPKYKGEVSRYNEDKRDKKPTVSVGIASLFGKRTDSLLKRLDELNSMAGKKEMELVITIADPENFKDDKRRALEAKIQTVGFPVTIVLTKKNTICTNRNLAASLSTGDYQIFVDDDVSLVGDVITTLVEALERRPEFGILSIASYSRRKELYKPRFVLKSFVDDTVLVSNLVLGMVTATRRDIIEVNPFLPLLANLGDDIHFVRQIHMLGFLGGYVLDTEVYAVDEQVGGSATKGQISIHPYLIEEGLSYFLNAHDYSEYEHRRAGFKIHTFSKENVSPQMAIRFWRRFSAAVLSFLQGDGNTFEFDMRTFNFPESIKVQVEAAIEYFQDQKDRIVKYKADEYDPKNLSHVNTFFGMLQYSAEIAQEDVSYVRPLESTAAERGKDDTTMLMEKERKAVARDLVELYSMHKEALSVFNNRQNVPIDEKSREARLARLYEAFFILGRLKKIYDTLSEEDSTIRKVLDHAIVQAKRFSKESFLYLADGSTPLSIIPFKQLTRFKDLRIDARHHHIALHPMMYLTDGISLSEVENPPLHAQNNHNHNDGEMTIALSGNIRVVEVNPHGEIEYTVPAGSIIKIPPKKLHRLTNPNEFSTTDFTLKDPFIALQKGFTDAGASPFEHIEIISPVIEMLSDGRGKVLTHYYPAIAHELRINEEQQLVLDDNNLPVVQAETYVKVSVVYINPGQSSDVFGINPIYPGFQTVRIFPWSEKIEPGWDMDERIKELKGEITLIDAAGKELRTDKVSGGDIVILNKGERDAASGFRIKNTGNAQTLVFAVIQEMQQEERLSEEFLERITLSELFKNIYDLWKDGQLELKGKTLETVKSIIVQKIPDAWHDTEAIIEYVDTFRDELTDKDRDLVALLLGSKDLIVEESKHDHAEPAFEPLPEQKRRTRKAGKEVTTTTEDMVRNNLLEMISAVSFASEQPATDSDAQLFECGGGYIGILPNNVIVVEGDDKEAVLNETYRMVIKLNAKGVSNSLDVIGYERSELDSEGSKKEKKIVRVFIRTTDQEPKFLIEDVMRLKMSRLNEYGPIISPANTGKETKDRYVREIDELRKEEFQDSNGDARNKMKPINPKDIKLSPYSRSEREEYLEAIKKVLNESDEKIANPEILKRAAEIALKGKQSSIEGKMGLQGGTFNPLTYGHITASLGGMISEELNGVVIANGGTVPDKPFASSAEIRNAMAELAVSGDQDLKDKIFVSDIRDAVVRMFEEGNAQDIAGENEDQRRFNMDMAAYIWLFMANPDIRWTFMVGSDKVNDYGRKDERNLVKTFKDNNIEVMYFERKGQEVDVDRNIMSYRWLSGFWQQGLFKKSRVSSLSALAASKVRAALYAQEPQIEGMDLGEAISPAILEFINGEGQMTLRLIYKLDNIDREITKYLKEFNYSEAINQSSESLREIKELRKKGIRPSEAQLINALEERLKSKIASLKDFGITSFRAAEELIRQASVSQGSVRLAIEMYKTTVDIYKNFEEVDTRRIFKLASSRLKRLEKSLDDFKEEFDIVDENGRNVGVATRAETHARGLRHKNVNVMVFSHDGKKFLGQIRAKSKDVFGGALSNGAAGHVERGVGSKETALKEGGEEIATKDQSKKLDFVPERLKLIGEEYEHAGYLQMYEFSWLNEEEKQKVLAVIERELSAQEGDKTGQVLHTVSDELSTVYLFTYNRYQREDLGKIVDSVVRSTGIRPGMSMDNQEMKSLYVYQLDEQEERTVNEIMFELRGSQDIEIDLAKGLGEVVGLVWVDFDELITRFNAHPEHYTDAFAPFLKDEGIIAQIKESLKRLNPIDLDSTIENLAIQRTSI